MCRTRANYWAEFLLDALVGTALVTAGVHHHDLSNSAAALTVGGGLLVFSFIEYFFHRWLFHGPILALSEAHAAHHRDPLAYDSLPFFVPAAVLMGLTAVFLTFIPLGDTCLLSGTIAFGYITYGLSHFTIHHLRFRQRSLRNWAARHYIHHFHPECNFGVTTSLWDFLLGTRYKPRVGKRDLPGDL